MPGLGWRFPTAMNPDGKSTQEQVSHRAYDIESRNGGFPEKLGGVSSCQSVVWNVNVPVLGRLRILKDKVGLVASSIVVLYWVYGNWSTWMAILIPRYLGGQMPVALMMSESIFLSIYLWNLYSATSRYYSEALPAKACSKIKVLRSL